MASIIGERDFKSFGFTNSGVFFSKKIVSYFKNILDTVWEIEYIFLKELQRSSFACGMGLNNYLVAIIFGTNTLKGKITDHDSSEALTSGMGGASWIR